MKFHFSLLVLALGLLFCVSSLDGLAVKGSNLYINGLKYRQGSSSPVQCGLVVRRECCKQSSNSAAYGTCMNGYGCIENVNYEVDCNKNSGMTAMSNEDGQVNELTIENTQRKNPSFGCLLNVRPKCCKDHSDDKDAFKQCMISNGCEGKISFNLDHVYCPPG